MFLNGMDAFAGCSSWRPFGVGEGDGIVSLVGAWAVPPANIVREE